MHPADRCRTVVLATIVAVAVGCFPYQPDTDNPVIPCRGSVYGTSQDGATVTISGNFVGGALSAKVFTDSSRYKYLPIQSSGPSGATADVRLWISGTYPVIWFLQCVDSRSANDSTGLNKITDAPATITIH